MSNFFKEKLIDLARLDFHTFHQKFDAEIKAAYNKNLIQVIADKYFAENVIPSIPL
jgi:hypothetical protein